MYMHVDQMAARPVCGELRRLVIELENPSAVKQEKLP
jgi:hypothetical protein